MISATKEIDLDQLIFCLGRASWKSGFNTVLFQCILEDCYCKQKHCFFGNISNFCNRVTHMGLKPPQKFFFENISKSTATRSFQNFGLIEGAAGIPSGL